MRGCSVFTRPPSISGARVTSSTLRRRRARAPRGTPPCRRCDELAAELGEAAREVVEAGLVVDGDQRAHASSARDAPRGSSRCSTAWIRSSQRLARSTGDRLLARGSAPVSTPSSTKCTVTPVAVDARGERVLDRVRAGERGQQRRVDVDDPLGEAVEERPASAGACSRRGRRARRRAPRASRHRRVALLAVGVAVERERRGRDAGRARALERVRVRAVRRDGDDGQARVDQRLQVRAVAAETSTPITLRSRPITSVAGRPARRRRRSSRCRG